MKRKYLFILLICLLPSVVFSITEKLIKIYKKKKYIYIYIIAEIL